MNAQPANSLLELLFALFLLTLSSSLMLQQVLRLRSSLQNSSIAVKQCLYRQNQAEFQR